MDHFGVPSNQHSSDGNQASMLWFCMKKLPKVGFQLAWTLLSILYVIPVHVAYIILLSILCLFGKAGKKSFWAIEEIFFSWILEIVASWIYVADYKIVESGDSLDDVLHQSLLFMPNHQSTADVALCMMIFGSRPGLSAKIMWVMDKQFKYSHFGLVSWIHDDFFILAGKENRKQSLEELNDHLQRVFMMKKRKILVLFPEGGFLRNRKESGHKFALKNDLPLLEYCTLPRTGSLEVIINVLGPKTEKTIPTKERTQINVTHSVNIYGITKTEKDPSSNPDFNLSLNADAISQTPPATPTVIAKSKESSNSVITTEKSNSELDKIVDTTIAYVDRNPLGIFSILSAYKNPCTTHVHYKIYDAKDIPQEPEELRSWMYKLYSEKEKLLKDFYRTGAFPRRGASMNSVDQPRDLSSHPIRYVTLNFFYIASTFLLCGLCSKCYTLL